MCLCPPAPLGPESCPALFTIVIFLRKVHWYLCVGRGPGLNDEMLLKATSLRGKPYKGIPSTMMGDPGRQSPTLGFRSLLLIIHGTGTPNTGMLTSTIPNSQGPCRSWHTVIVLFHGPMKGWLFYVCMNACMCLCVPHAYIPE